MAASQIILLVATLMLLLAHAWLYRFLTDDAFISFRYSVNLSHGQGLVFNPGAERVEGYSNFLWVLILAGVDRLGIRPEQAALPLSLLLTSALWALCAWFAWRRRREGEPAWIVAVPLLLLAATRSIAVWSTSGLETRLFEVLVVAGALRLIIEARGLERAERRLLIATWAFALATLTRPDGLLISLCAFAAAAVWIRARARGALTHWLLGLIPFVVLVAAHFIWRRVYHGDWLPNTYYAKVGGRTWWGSGFLYLEAFVLEYAAYLWLPFIAAGVWYAVRRGATLMPLVFAAVVIPHALYVASIGGDHFEYRPLDLYFPFAFLLIGEGVRVLSAWPALNRFALGGLLLVLLGLFEFPWQSHVQFPNHYLTGYPGALARDPEAIAYLDPNRDPIFWLRPLNVIARMHQRAVHELTANFVAVRAEEHRMFLGTVVPEGRRIRALINQGVLPRDVRIAMGSVGAIPYYAGVWTLDRVGLTDAHVAHSAPALEHGRRLMAHDKSATIEYAQERGVDLWTYDPVHLIEPAHARRMLVAIRDALTEGKDAWAAPLTDSEYVLCRLPLGPESTARRIPRLHFVSVTNRDFIADWSRKARPYFEAAVAEDTKDIESLGQLAFVEMASQNYSRAATYYELLLMAAPDSPEAWEYLGVCRVHLGDRQGGLHAIERSLDQGRKNGDPAATRRLESERLAILREIEAGH